MTNTITCLINQTGGRFFQYERRTLAASPLHIDEINTVLLVPICTAFNHHRSIGKLCNLVAVGFGDAGAEIIADNIRSTQELDPIMPGKRVQAIFAFCDVRHFTSVTEVLLWVHGWEQHRRARSRKTQVLQEEIMEFVNNIARIVHLEVTLHGGFPNKNVGDAFLLVWKLPPRPGDPRAPPQRHGRTSGTPSQPPSLQEVLDKYGIATEEHLQGRAVGSMLSAALGQAGEHTLQRCALRGLLCNVLSVLVMQNVVSCDDNAFSERCQTFFPGGMRGNAAAWQTVHWRR